MKWALCLTATRIQLLLLLLLHIWLGRRAVCFYLTHSSRCVMKRVVCSMGALHILVLLVAAIFFLRPTAAEIYYFGDPELPDPIPGKCHPELWAKWDKFQYIHVVNKQTATFTEAESFCYNLGGHLLKMTDKKYEDWVIRHFGNILLEQDHTHYWIGLEAYPQKNTYRWQDGSNWRLKKDYSNWAGGSEPPHRSGNFCVAVEWHTSGKWTPQPCDKRFKFVCEAKSGECKGRPRSTFNGRVPEYAGQMLWFDREQDVSMICNLTGNRDLSLYDSIHQYCGRSLGRGRQELHLNLVQYNESLQAYTGNTSLWMEFYLTYKYNYMQCFCLLYSVFGWDERWWIYLQVRVSLRFVGVNTSVINNYNTTEGTEFQHDLQVYAAPTPHSFSLFRGDSQWGRKERVDSGRFEVEARRETNESVTHTLTFRLFNPGPDETGFYTLTIDNGNITYIVNSTQTETEATDRMLTWQFYLEVEAKGWSLEFKLAVAGALAVLGILLCCCCCCCCCRGSKRKKANMSEIEMENFALATRKSLGSAVNTTPYEQEQQQLKRDPSVASAAMRNPSREASMTNAALRKPGSRRSFFFSSTAL